MTHFSVDEILNLPDNKKRETLEKLLAELKSLKGKDKYGLYWDLNATTEGEENVIKECQTFFPVLDAIKDENGLKHLTQFAPPQSDLFDNPDKPQPTHLLIEGDNYHALNALLYTHRKAVDLIYIDPPYNTGNKDFRYNDNFIDKENGGRHTLWLSFMKNRLELAKELLKDTGVIFISIDDNEQAQLKLLCDKIFKEENFIANVIWQKSKKGDSKWISITHEYILAFSKNKSASIINGKWRQKKAGVEEVLEHYQYLKKKHLNKHDLITTEMRAWFRNLPIGDMRKAHKHYNFSDDRGLYFADNFAGPDDGRKSRPRYDIIHPTTLKSCKKPSTGWRWDEETTRKALAEIPSRIHFGEDETTIPNRKSYLFEIDKEPYSSVFYRDGRKGTLDLENIVGKGQLPFPKNVEVMNDLINLITNKDTPSVVLDFFAGSGTTGHAVLELNKQDGGRRQFILVTNNEVTDKTQAQLRKEGKTEADIQALGICRSVTYPRLQKVIEGYTTPKGEKVEGTGGRLRYYRTEYVERSPNFDQQAYNFKGKCTEMLCIKENVFTPLADSNDKPYDAEGWEVYRDYDKTLGILHDDTPQYRSDLKAVLAQQTGHAVLYIFGLGSGISLDEYNNYFEKAVRIEPMPTEIMNLYKRKFDRKKK